MNPDGFHVCADCRVSSQLIKSITKQTNAIMFQTWQGEGDQNPHRGTDQHPQTRPQTPIHACLQ